MRQAYAFVSYVREDELAVDRLCAALREAGIAVWRDKDNLWPGDRWKLEIRHAIEGGAFFLACFSARAVAKQRSYMYEELVLAVEELRQHPPDRRWFIPVRLEPCDVPELPVGAGETLRSLQRVDLFPDWESSVAKLARTVLSSTARAPYVDHPLLAADIAGLRTQLQSGSTREKEIAALQLGEHAADSPDALNALVSALVVEEDREVIDSLSSVLASVGQPGVERLCSLLRAFLADPRRSTYARAAPVLGAIGVNAACVVPLLGDMVRADPDGVGGRSAVNGLASFGPASVEILLDLAADTASNVRANAFSALGSIGQAAEDGVPLMIAALEEDPLRASGELRSSAAKALGKLKLRPEISVPALISALPRQPDSAAAWVIRALGEFGPAAAAAVPSLTRELLAGEGHTRGEAYPYDPKRDAAEALGRIGASSVETLRNALAASDSWVAALAARALGTIGPAASSAVPELCRLAQSDDPSADAIAALGHIGVCSRAVLAAIREGLHASGLPSVTEAALRAALDFGDRGRKLLPDVLAHIDQSDDQRRTLVIGFAVSVGAPAVLPVIEIIEAQCERGHRGARGWACWSAVECLTVLSASNDEARPKIEALSTHQEWEVRAMVVKGLAAIQRGDDLASWQVAILQALADDEEQSVYDLANKTLRDAQQRTGS